MKILSLTHDKEARLYIARVLIHNVEYGYAVYSVEKLIEKILHRDKFSTREDVEMDVQLNYREVV